MFNSDVDLPVPRTVRPIGMLGGGASSSRESGSADGRRRGSNAPRNAPSSSAAASPSPQGSYTVSSAASPAPSGARGAASSASLATPAPAGAGQPAATPTTPLTTDGAPTPTTTRPTITIFTELEDEAEEGDMNAGGAWMGAGASTGSYGSYLQAQPSAPAQGYRGASHSLSMDGTVSQRQPSALMQTETSLSPQHYRTICSSNTGVADSYSSLTPLTGNHGGNGAANGGGSGGPSFSAARPPADGSGDDRRSNTTPSNGPPPLDGGAWAAELLAPVEPHPVRLSATPVVPIVPHVAEPSCRRRVAADLERLYGPNGTQTAPSAPASPQAAAAGASSPPPAAPAKAGEAAANTAVDPKAATPPGQPSPKKKKGGFLFSSPSPSSSSSAAKKAAAKAAEAKRKAAPPTAAERKQAREQVIRVGVQRLYQRLGELHLIVYHVKNDGNCQFRAISHQLFGNEDYHDIIRSQVVSYMRTARSECYDFFFESSAQADAYYDNLAKPGSWGDELSLRAASDCLYVNIHVLSSEEKNFYITYRPTMDHAAFAPSFLIDVLKLRERRRAERKMLRSHGLQGCCGGRVPSAASFDPGSSGTGGHAGYRAGGDFSGYGAAATMPDMYARNRTGARHGHSASGGGAPALLVPAAAGGFSSRTSQPALSQPISREPSGLMMDHMDGASRYGDEEEEEEGEVDAHAIQLALHKKLQQSEIRCSLPYSATGSCSLGPAGTGGRGAGASSMPLLQPQRCGGGQRHADPTQHASGGATLLQPAAVPTPRLLSGDEDLSKGPRENQVERFRAVGAEVQDMGDAAQALNIFTQRRENVPVSAVDGDGGYVRLRRTAEGTEIDARPATSRAADQQPAGRPALLRPQSTAAFPEGTGKPPMAAASASSLPYTAGPFSRPLEDGGEMMLLASSSHRSRANASLQHSFSCMQTANSYGGYNSGSTYGEGFNAHPAQGSFPHSFAGGGGHPQHMSNGGGYAQSLGSLVPVSASSPAGSLLHSGADAAAATADASGGPVSYFKFEPRTEPIDIFLSYLYPVHYNSLSVAQDQPSQPAAGDDALAASTRSPAQTSVKVGANTAAAQSLGSSTGAASGEGTASNGGNRKLAPPSISGSVTASQYHCL